MQEIKLNNYLNERWTEAVAAYLRNQFNGEGLEFHVTTIGESNFALHVKGPIGSKRDQLFYWTGYYSGQIMANPSNY